MISSDEIEAMEMIRESARGIADRGDLRRVRAQRYNAPGFDRTVWREICEMGWPGLRLPEEKGGVGLGMGAYCALAEELGAALTPEPLIGAALVAALLDKEALEAHLAGERVVLPAWQDGREAVGPDGLLDVADGRVTAVKQFVPLANGADDFLVIGSDRVALVAADAPGVAVEAEGTQDGGTVATIRFDGAPARLIDADPAGPLAEAALATSAYLLGLMEAALAMTVDYLKTRVQFGKPIGSFQVLQHMAVDLRLEIELTRASVEDAAADWDRGGSTQATLAAVSRAKVRASNAALKVTRDAVQLHGGIGFTDEHDIGLFLRKALVVAGQFGTARAHATRFAALRMEG